MNFENAQITASPLDILHIAEVRTSILHTFRFAGVKFIYFQLKSGRWLQNVGQCHPFPIIIPGGGEE
jgi:hypothetical protein